MSELESDRAHEIEREIVERVARTRSQWVELAERLHDFHTGKGWVALGLDSFNEWLGQPEIGIDRGSAYTMRVAWRELVVEHGLKPDALTVIDVSKLAVVLPAIRRGDVDIVSALYDAQTLSRSDLRAQYQSPSHAEYRVCEACGQRVKIEAPA